MLISLLLAVVLAPLARALVRLLRAGWRRARTLMRRLRRAAQRGWREQAIEMFGALPLTEGLPEEAHEEIAEHVELLRFRPGQSIIRQGEKASRFYLVRSGSVEVVKVDDDGEERRIRRLEAGRSFGEIALLEGITRTATVRALSPVEVFAIDKGTFDRALAGQMGVAEEVRRELLSVAELRRMAPFQGLDDADAARLLSGASWRSFAPGERIVKQGDEADSFFVVSSGQVEVVEGRRVIRRLGQGAYFGEIALLIESPRTATVRAVTQTHVIELARGSFDKVLAKSFRRGRLAPSRELTRDWEH